MSIILDWKALIETYLREILLCVSVFLSFFCFHPMETELPSNLLDWRTWKERNYSCRTRLLYFTLSNALTNLCSFSTVWQESGLFKGFWSPLVSLDGDILSWQLRSSQPPGTTHRPLIAFQSVPGETRRSMIQIAVLTILYYDS